MIPRQMSENVVRTNFAPGIHRKQLARLDPENSQMVTSKSLSETLY